MTNLRLSQTAVFAVVLAFMAVFMLGHLGVLTAGARAERARSTAADAAHAPPPRLGRVLFAPTFPAGSRLVTNDYAYFNPTDRQAARSTDWTVTSGSLFARDGSGWTGVPDSLTPNLDSTNGTGSAVFRLVTRRRDFENVAVSFDLLNHGYVTTLKTPAHAWDGIHLFLHYHSQHSLYALTLNRRDNTVLVKKKTPGGPANGGTYHSLGPPVPYTPELNHWQHVLATITTTPQGAVTITLSIGGKTLLDSTDAGSGGRPLSSAGAIGLRGDNTQFRFRHFVVRALASAPRAT